MKRIKRPQDYADLLRAQAEQERKALLHTTTRGRVKSGDWRTVGGFGPAGAEPAFEGGWFHNLDDNPVQFILSSGTVQIKGIARTSSGGVQSAFIFYLPDDYVPTTLEATFDVDGKRQDGSSLTVPISIQQAGTPPGGVLINIFAMSGDDYINLAEITLDGISFPAIGTAVQQPANPDTSGATLAALETEVNQLKAALRAYGVIAG